MTLRTPADFDDLSSIGVTTELIPAAGHGAPVAPPTFGGPTPDARFSEKIAFSENMTIPEYTHTGWSNVARNAETGEPRRGAAVLMNSIGAESAAFEQALKDLELDGTFRWGGIVVEPWDAARVDEYVDGLDLSKIPDSDTMREALRSVLLSVSVDSWTASHRHCDAAIRYAEDPSTGKQVWEGGDLKRRIVGADATRDADWLMRNVANALMSGYWLSTPTSPLRPKWARALTSEVIGYDAHLVRTGYVKGSAIGDTPRETFVDLDGLGRLIVDPTKNKVPDGHRPSVFGFGQVPINGGPDASAVACGLILRRTGLSLNHLRGLRSGSGEKARRAIIRGVAAMGVYATAAVSAEGVFLRSGADLSLSPEHPPLWTLRTRTGDAVRQDMDVATARGLLDQAFSDLDDLGLGQAEPIRLTLSEAMVDMIASRVRSTNKPEEK